jgi:hypothetical protein
MKTNIQKQADRRKREKEWLGIHHFTSWEAVHTALMNGAFFVSQPTPKGENKMTDEPKVINTSPTPPVKPVQVYKDFAWAIVTIQHGEKVTKREWNDPKIVVGIFDGLLQITLPKNNYAPCPLTVSEGDIMGTDWVKVE